MPSLALRQIERGLAELDCPPAQRRRRMRELAEHHEDLKRDALEEGLSEMEAEARADKLLGEPAALAGQFAAALRQSSWWGRHPIIGFCLLPPFVILLLFTLTLWFDYGVCYVSLPEDQLSSLADGGRELKFCRGLVIGNFYASVVLAAALFATLARRTAAGIKWSMIACLMCALLGAFWYVSVTPHNLSVGLWNHVQWRGLLLPLAVAFAAWSRWRQSLKVLAPLPAALRLPRIKAVPLPNVPRSSVLTPTSIITFLILALITLLICDAYREIHSHPGQTAESAAQSNK